MLLLVGLGNPGKEYESTRHNVGFKVIDSILDSFSFSGPKRKFNGLLWEGFIGSEKALLLKPMTFMNVSGRSLQEILRFYKFSLDDIYVFHDDLDIALGNVKVKKGGGNAGHNGLKDISSAIGNDYYRVRIGIGHPGSKDKVSSYVLHPFAKKELDIIDPVISSIVDNISSLIENQHSQFLHNLN